MNAPEPSGERTYYFSILSSVIQLNNVSLQKHHPEFMKESNDNSYQSVNKLFVEYLQRHHQRKTPERFAILKEIYDTEGHFNVEVLHEKMKDGKYLVSRATIYNTIKLLLDCGLVIRHQFGHNGAQYERSFKFRQHDHFIDIESGEVMEYCDPRVLEIQKSVEKELGVEISYHSLIFYGKSKKNPDKTSAIIIKKDNIDGKEQD